MAKMFFLTLFFHLTTAHAFLIATYDQAPLDYAKETDIFVVGYAGELGSGFLKTAMTYAHKTREQFPERQIVFYVENREKDYTSSKYTSKLGLVNVAFDSTPATTTKVMTELKAFSKIHTLHVVSHSALENGIGLTDRDADGRWNNKTKDLNKLRFTADGYVILHGCNTGFLQAPDWSRQMKVPVFGSLTATNFQQIFDDGQWWFHDAALYPETAEFLTINNVAFDKPVSCDKGGCYRLKADFFSYNGYWGDFNGGGGLSFYKSFCNFSDKIVKISDRKKYCMTAMRQFIQIFPSELSLSPQSTLEEYKTVVKDFMCGIHRTKNIRGECYQKLEEAETNSSLKFDGFKGNPLQCNNFGPCDVTFTCVSGTGVHNCVLKAPKTKAPTTMVEEYLTYLEAY